jgi:SH3 domain-containing protein
LSGLLVGYKDAYTYRSMLDARLTGADIAPIPTLETPTEIPTVTPETPSGLTPTVEGGAASEATTEITPAEGAASPTPEGARPTNTVPPTATEQPTETPTPTATPTATVTPSITPTFEPAIAVRGVIDSNQGVNVREGPGRTFPPIASLSPGTIVQITGRNGDGTWLKVKLDDGTEGWVSASLVGVEAPPQSTEEATQTSFNIDLNNQVAGLISDIDLYAPLAQAETPVPETTVEAGNVEPTAAPITDIPALPAATPYRDERWYGMTLGLVAIIVVITIGMIANIVRGLFRRGK